MSVDIELCAGAGGLGIGLRRAGFGAARFYEIDKHSCDTLRQNIASPHPTLTGVVYGEKEGDIKHIAWRFRKDEVRLLAAGTPCQPFSLGGKHLALEDGRNLFPDILRSIRELRPKAILLENVRGLLRPGFTPYFEYILRQLESPAIRPKSEEIWQAHDERIRKYRRTPGYVPEYDVQWRLCDAADYGVPQNRLRVFIMATRIDLPAYRFPPTTHSKNALIRVMKSGEYWERHGVQPPPEFPESESLFIPHPDGEKLPWQTVRDAIYDLPDPSPMEEGAWANHWSISGARVYVGHSGSLLDWPAKAIKAGVHGVPGGENILISSDGANHYFTLRETARLQTFPDEHYFEGARLHVTRQIGNAVPCRLAQIIGQPLFEIVEPRTNIHLVPAELAG